MIGNLLHNACKFTGPGGRIDVRLELDPADEAAVVTIEDTGIGIDPTLLPHLFDAFSQAHQDLDRSKGGLGLGLALVKGLAELHGGSVLVRSRGVGHGAAFLVRVPAVQAPATPQGA